MAVWLLAALAVASVVRWFDSDAWLQGVALQIHGADPRIGGLDQAAGAPEGLARVLDPVAAQARLALVSEEIAKAGDAKRAAAGVEAVGCAPKCVGDAKPAARVMWPVPAQTVDWRPVPRARLRSPPGPFLDLVFPISVSAPWRIASVLGVTDRLGAGRPALLKSSHVPYRVVSGSCVRSAATTALPGGWQVISSRLYGKQWTRQAFQLNL